MVVQNIQQLSYHCLSVIDTNLSTKCVYTVNILIVITMETTTLSLVLFSYIHLLQLHHRYHYQNYTIDIITKTTPQISLPKLHHRYHYYDYTQISLRICNMYVKVCLYVTFFYTVRYCLALCQ